MMNFTRLAGGLLLATASIAASAASSTSAKVAMKQELKSKSLFERISAIRHSKLDRDLAAKGFGSIKTAPITADGMDNFGDFGWMRTASDDYWYYAVTIERETLSGNGASFKEETITGFKLSVYNEKCELVGKVNADIPLLEGETKITSIDFADVLTKKFFNTDNNYEVMVLVNANTPKYVNNVRTYAFSIKNTDEKVEPVCVVDGMMVSATDASTDQWSETFYMIFDNDGYANPDGSFTPASGDKQEGAVRSQRFTIMQKAGYSTPPSEVAHIDISDDQANYNDGLPMLVRKHNNLLYIAATGYEKPYFVDPNDFENMEITPDNYFCLTLYTMPLTGYGTKKLTTVGTTKVPVVKSTDNDVPFSFYGAGTLEYMDDMIIDDDGNVSYVVTTNAYHISTDGSTYSYFIYAADGSLTKTIFENAESVITLSDVSGFPRQDCFITVDENGKYAFNFMNMDTFDKVLTMPADFQNNTLSTAMDRIPSSDGEYRYVVRMGVTQENEEGHLCECLNWFRPDGSFDHQRLFYLGEDVAIATPNITATVLNPYFINTDDQHEVMFLVGRYTGESSKTKTELLVLNEKNETVFNIVPTEEQGEISRVWTFNESSNPTIVIVYAKTSSDYHAEIYKLPLSKFAGGSGTADDPYLVATAGDLAYISKNPAAHYRLVNDIDASLITIEGSSSDFTGTLDGNGKTISNLHLTGKHCSLFGSITGPQSTGAEGEAPAPAVKNLNFINPTMELSGENTCGLLAGLTFQNVTIENVHVYGLTTVNNGFSGSFGGLVGDATSSSALISCSVNNASIDLPESSIVGGLVANLKASSKIAASSFSGSLVAANNAGGIAGNSFEAYSAQLCSIRNCHVNASISATHTVGGITGSDNHNYIVNNFVEGSLTATGATNWNGPIIGGVIGSLEWLAGSGDCIAGNIVNLSALNFVPVNNETNAYKYETAHRIVGKTYYNDYAEDKDGYLKNNFSVGTLAPAFPAEIYAGKEGVEGETIEKDNLTADFCKEIGFAFGNSSASPWDESAKNTLRLFFENTVKGIVASPASVEMEQGDNTTVIFSCVGGSADDITIDFPESDVIAKNFIVVEDEKVGVGISALKEGEAAVTASADNFSCVCKVKITKNISGGVESTLSTEIASILTFDGSVVKAADSSEISIYDASGRFVARGKGIIATSALAKGFYIAKSADSSLKFIVK